MSACTYCGRPIRTGHQGSALGMCGAHYQRHRRGKDMSAPIKPYRLGALAALEEAALRYANAEGGEEFARAKDGLRMAARRWAQEARP